MKEKKAGWYHLVMLGYLELIVLHQAHDEVELPILAYCFFIAAVYKLIWN